MGSTLQNYNELKLHLIYKQFTILRVVKNGNDWFNIEIQDSKRQTSAYNAVIAYTYLFFDQRFRLPTCFNSLSINVK